MKTVCHCFSEIKQIKPRRNATEKEAFVSTEAIKHYQQYIANFGMRYYQIEILGEKIKNMYNLLS